MNDIRAREKTLFEYSAALERGDFEAVARILRAAEDDMTLAESIREMNDMQPDEMADQATKRVFKFAWAQYAGIAALLICGTLGALTLLGPRIGNVFSSTVSGMGAAGGANGQQVAAQPTMPPFPTQAYTPAPQVGFVGATPLAGLPTPTAAGTQGPTAPGQEPPPDRLIIKNGELDLLVENTDAAIDQVTQIAADNGGYVLSTQAFANNGVKNATLTIAVQAAQFDTAMRRLRQTALEVQREISTGQDVTAEYVDLESRLKNLEATAERIRGFLAQAKTVQEALDINNQLSAVDAQIEQIKGRMNFLGGRAAFSTITINLNQKVNVTPTPTPTLTPTPSPTEPWSLGPAVENAAKTQTNLLRGLLELLAWLAVVPGPYMLIGGLAWWGYRTWVARRKPPTPPAAS